MLGEETCRRNLNPFLDLPIYTNNSHNKPLVTARFSKSRKVDCFLGWVFHFWSVLSGGGGHIANDLFVVSLC